MDQADSQLRTEDEPREAEQPSGGADPAAGEQPQPQAEPQAQAVTVEDVMDALTGVIDPELGLDFVELGLIYGVEVDGGSVSVTYSLTTPGCPIGPQVAEQIEDLVGEIEGVAGVSSELVFSPAWSPERMSEDAKFALGF